MSSLPDSLLGSPSVAGYVKPPLPIGAVHDKPTSIRRMLSGESYMYFDDAQPGDIVVVRWAGSYATFQAALAPSRYRTEVWQDAICLGGGGWPEGWGVWRRVWQIHA